MEEANVDSSKIVAEWVDENKISVPAWGPKFKKAVVNRSIYEGVASKDNVSVIIPAKNELKFVGGDHGDGYGEFRASTKEGIVIPSRYNKGKSIKCKNREGKIFWKHIIAYNYYPERNLGGENAFDVHNLPFGKKVLARVEVQVKHHARKSETAKQQHSLIINFYIYEKQDNRRSEYIMVESENRLTNEAIVVPNSKLKINFIKLAAKHLPLKKH